MGKNLIEPSWYGILFELFQSSEILEGCRMWYYTVKREFEPEIVPCLEMFSSPGGNLESRNYLVMNSHYYHKYWHKNRKIKSHKNSVTEWGGRGQLVTKCLTPLNKLFVTNRDKPSHHEMPRPRKKAHHYCTKSLKIYSQR